MSGATTVDEVKALLAEEGWTIVEEIPDEDLAEVPNAIGGLAVMKTVDGADVMMEIAIFDSEANATAYMEELSGIESILGLTAKQSGRCVFIIFNDSFGKDEMPDVSVELEGVQTVDAAISLFEEDGYVVERITADEEGNIPENCVGGFSALKTTDSYVVIFSAILFDSEENATAYLKENAADAEEFGVEQQGCWVYMQTVVEEDDTTPDVSVDVKVDFSDVKTAADVEKLLTEEGWTIVDVATDEDLAEEPNAIGGIVATKTVNGSEVELVVMIFNSEESATAYLKENAEMAEIVGLKQSGCCIFTVENSGGSVVPDGSGSVNLSGATTVDAGATVLERAGWNVYDTSSGEDFDATFVNAIGRVLARRVSGDTVFILSAVLFDSEESATAYMKNNADDVSEFGLKQSGCWVYMTDSLNVESGSGSGGTTEDPSTSVHFTTATTLEEAAKILESQGWNTDIYTDASMLKNYPNSVGILAAQRDDNNNAYTTAILFSSEESATTYMRTNTEDVEKWNLIQVGCWVYGEEE